MKRYLCIHGHFYQPPRENPWLEEVEMQDSAAPFHDWNQRITAECYAPNTASRILDPEHRIIDIVNNYSKMSFNFGPTLLSWLHRHQPHIHDAIVEADRVSRERFDGHGSALAQVYNHMIMPLANRRDKFTQAYWGVEDFRTRFGRDPEGMWLPEAAVDLETLEVLADLGIKFTILSPRQASRVRTIGQKEWTDVSGERVDPKIPYLCRLPSGQEIVLFFYDGPISRDLAFGDMLSSGENLRNRLMGAYSPENDTAQLVHIATDGESYGHHFRYGEMALSYCLYLVENDPDTMLINYGQFLELHPPIAEAEIFENSSWSCVHGVERWRADCGCNSGMRPGWHQAWRAPLRRALDWLGDRAAEVYEDKAADVFKDPWEARNQYIEVILNRDRDNVDRFLSEHGNGRRTVQDEVHALKLLELQRYAQLIYTSCGWFFDELSGIETVQVLQYAAKTIQMIEDLSGEFLEEQFETLLADAPSNVLGNGARVFREYVMPARVTIPRVGAHFAISSLFEDYPEEFDLGCFRALTENYELIAAGRSSLATGKVALQTVVTREKADIEFAAFHFGDHNVTCGVRAHSTNDDFRRMRTEITSIFERGDFTEAVRILDKHFMSTYSVFHLFRDEQRKVVSQILEHSYASAESAFRSILENNYTVLNFLHWLNIKPPIQLTNAAEHVIKIDLTAEFESPTLDMDRFTSLIRDAAKWSLNMDDEGLKFSATTWITNTMDHISAHPDDIGLIERLSTVLSLLDEVLAGLNLWEAQNRFFFISTEKLSIMRRRAEKRDDHARRWVAAFSNLGDLLKIKTE
ncbi:MAG: DUF3536 domain-containing protein [Desulfovibrionales bacterium]